MSTIKLTAREQALFDLAMSGTDTRLEAVEACRAVMGRPLCSLPDERVNVATALQAKGWDGMGRVESAESDLAHWGALEKSAR